MRVLVIGGTGFVGASLARELVDRGHDVTVLSRSPDDADADRPAGVRTVAGDVTDYESIESAFEGRDAVVNLVALSPLFEPKGGKRMHERVHLGGTENVVRAAEAHGVSRLVQLSALGADPDGPTAYIRAKGRAEEVVRKSDLDWVVVRPSVVFGAGSEFLDFTRKLTTPYVTGLPGGGKTRFQPLWVEDLTPMLADAVESDEHAERTYELGGPDVLTLAAVARLAHRAEGRSLTVLPVPMALARVGLTLGGRIPGFPMGPDQYRSLAFDNTVSENDVRAFGRDPAALRSLADYLGVDGAADAGADEDGSRPDASTAAAILGGVAAWAAVSFLTLLAGLGAGVWRLSDLTTRAGAIPDLAPSAALTLLLVGGPVAAFLRWGLVAPLALLLLYAGGWAAFGLATGFGGVAGLFVAGLYAGLALPVVAAAGVAEWALRRWRGGGRHSRPAME